MTLKASRLSEFGPFTHFADATFADATFADAPFADATFADATFADVTFAILLILLICPFTYAMQQL